SRSRGTRSQKSEDSHLPVSAHAGRTNTRGGVLADTAPTARGGTSSVLGFADVRRLQPLRTARHVELERLALGERLEPLAGDGREMHEHVLALRLGDESKALRLVEPLHGATSHLKLLVVSGSEDPHLPRITSQTRPVSVTDAPIDWGCSPTKN